MLVNTSKFGSALASQFASSGTSSKPDHAVVLMRRHGFTTQAQSIETAVYRAIYTKINAKAQTDSLAVMKNFGGEERMFDAGDLGLTEDQCDGCSIMNEQFQEKPWKFWVKEVESGRMYVNRLG
jgi:Class II Aldolase and Adducin N-terminal domain